MIFQLLYPVRFFDFIQEIQRSQNFDERDLTFLLIVNHNRNVTL